MPFRLNRSKASMHIVISEFMDEPAVQALSKEFDVRYEPDLVSRREALMEAVERADALIVRNATQVDVQLLAKASVLKAVGRLGVGLDNIDVQACRARDIQVIPATGANARSVAEYVIAATLILLRGAFASSDSMAAGKWPRGKLSTGLEVGGRTLGIVGFGATGRLAADMAQGLGMQVIAYDPMLPADAPAWRDSGVERTELDALLARSDAVTLHIPLTADTRNLFDAGKLAAMKPGAVFINTARGGIVDETALAKALKNGALRGAALDVFEHEPLPAGSPLADAPNLFLTPHIAGGTADSNERISALIGQRIAETLRAH